MGLSDVERRRADALAERRYVAPAFDLHGGRRLGDPEEMLARCGQAPIQDVVCDHLRHLSWEPDDDFPSSLRPRRYPESVPVVIDPRFGHGLPVVAAHRVTVKAITDLWGAGESVEGIAYDYDVTPEQVDALSRAVARLAARVPPGPESRGGVRQKG